GPQNGTHSSLTVRVRYADGSEGERTLLTISDPGVKWVKTKVGLSSSDPFQFVFDGHIADLHSSVSIDDVSYSSDCYRSTTKWNGKGNGRGHGKGHGKSPSRWFLKQICASVVHSSLFPQMARRRWPSSWCWWW